jgi:hypothetical protein
VKGVLAPQSVLAFARAQQPDARSTAPAAARLYASQHPRIAVSPFWIWPEDDSASLSGAAVCLPGRCWLGASLLGAAVLQTSAHGDKRLRLGGGAGAMLVFPNVPLSQFAALAVRLSQQQGDDEIVAAIALLPCDFPLESDHAAADAAATNWSSLQSLCSEPAAISLDVPWDAPDVGHVALSLRNKGPRASEFSILQCEGVWLLPRVKSAPAAQFVTPAAAIDLRDTDFDDVRLDEVYVGETYRHLDLSVFLLSESGRVWRTVKFKLFEENGLSGLEFRIGHGLPECFAVWPGTEVDSFGPFYKIVGARELAEAIESRPEQEDRLLLAALDDILPNLVRTLTARGKIEGDEAKRWLAIARQMHASAI